MDYIGLGTIPRNIFDIDLRESLALSNIKTHENDKAEKSE